MSNRAKYLGAVGTIVDGRVRDLQEHRDLGYPVFARDIGTTAPQEMLRVSEVYILPASMYLGDSNPPSMSLASRHIVPRLMVVIDQHGSSSPIRRSRCHCSPWRLPYR